ncbi:MAG: ATP-binding protein [Proteobacteria bacterium]|nr:ATP-binding protein [Pseudomonadota bacterium]
MIRKIILNGLAVCSFLKASDDMMMGGGQRNPLANLDYTVAFNFSKIYKKYAGTLMHMGLNENIDLKIEEAHTEGTYSILMEERQFEKCQAECLKQLNFIRRYTLLGPAGQGALMLALLSGGSFATIELTGSGSFGGSFAVFNTVFSSIFILPRMLPSLFYACKQPISVLDEREREFAKNQCFIPNTLWPKIIETFIKARQKQVLDAELNFLDFALNLQTLKPKPQYTISATIEDALYNRLLEFFRKYDGVNDCSLEGIVLPILTNINNFINALRQGTGYIRPLFLVGKGGIGKTEFAKVIYKEITKHIEVVQFYNEIITSPICLEGSNDVPGLFLRILQKMCTANALGSIVMLDEASWLNEEPYIDSVKRTFNGAFSKVNTTMFGSGETGQGIDFDMPPMLVIVAANKDIEDQALKSRFVSINFPNPKKESLIEHGKSLLNSVTEEELKVLLKCESFRDVESVVDVIKTRRCFIKN